jgi:hypothetical protein
MSSIAVLDPAVKVVLACNDDMAMGAIDAVEGVTLASATESRAELVAARMQGFISMGFDDIETNDYLRPEAGNLAKMFASVSWRNGFVRGIKSIAQMWASKLPSLLPARVGEIFEKCEKEEVACPLKQNLTRVWMSGARVYHFTVMQSDDRQQQPSAHARTCTHTALFCKMVGAGDDAFSPNNLVQTEVRAVTAQLCSHTSVGRGSGRSFSFDLSGTCVLVAPIGSQL